VVNFFLLEDQEKSILAANAAAAAVRNVENSDSVLNSCQKERKVDCPKLTFKSRAIVQKVLALQLAHIKCLIPPKDLLLHYKGSDGKVHKIGQSSKNELLHQNANRHVFKGWNSESRAINVDLP